MTTQSQLRPWVISRLEGHISAWVDVKDFRKRNNAEDYLHILKMLRPDFKYELNFRGSGRLSPPLLTNELSSLVTTKVKLLRLNTCLRKMKPLKKE